MCIHGWHVMCTGTSCSIFVLLVSCLHAMLIKARKCCASRLHLDYWQLPLFSERCQIWPRFHKSLRTVTSLSCQVDSPCFCIQSHPGVFLKKLCSPARCESLNLRYSSQYQQRRFLTAYSNELAIGADTSYNMCTGYYKSPHTISNLKCLALICTTFC